MLLTAKKLVCQGSNNCDIEWVKAFVMLNCKAPKPLPTNLVLFSKNHAKCYQKHWPICCQTICQIKCVFSKIHWQASAWITFCRCGTIVILADVVKKVSLRNIVSGKNTHPAIKLNLIFRHPVIHKFNVFCWLEEWFLFFFQSPVFFVNKDPCQIHHHCLSNNYFQLNFVSHLLHLCA